MTIKHGIATWTGVGVALITILPPAIVQLIALIENVAVHWTSAEKTSLITGAIATLGVIVLKGAQAVAAIKQGQTNV